MPWINNLKLMPKLLLTFGVLLLVMLLQGIVEIVRCVRCIRDGEWPSREQDVEEVDVDKLKQMVHVKDEDIEKLDALVAQQLVPVADAGGRARVLRHGQVAVPVDHLAAVAPATASARRTVRRRRRPRRS